MYQYPTNTFFKVFLKPLGCLQGFKKPLWFSQGCHKAPTLFTVFFCKRPSCTKTSWKIYWNPRNLVKTVCFFFCKKPCQSLGLLQNETCYVIQWAENSSNFWLYLSINLHAIYLQSKTASNTLVSATKGHCIGLICRRESYLSQALRLTGHNKCLKNNRAVFYLLCDNYMGLTPFLHFNIFLHSNAQLPVTLIDIVYCLLGNILFLLLWGYESEKNVMVLPLRYLLFFVNFLHITHILNGSNGQPQPTHRCKHTNGIITQLYYLKKAYNSQCNSCNETSPYQQG